MMEHKFLAACSEEEREAQQRTLDYANTTIVNTVDGAIRALFGLQGAMMMRAHGTSVYAAIYAAVESAVELAYYDGGRVSFGQSQVSVDNLKAALVEALHGPGVWPGPVEGPTDG